MEKVAIKEIMNWCVCALTLKKLRGQIRARTWCCEVVGSCEVQLSCEVRCSTSLQPDKNLCHCASVWGRKKERGEGEREGDRMSVIGTDEKR